MATAFTVASCTVNDQICTDGDKFINIVASIAPQSRTPQLSEDGSGSFSVGDNMSLFVESDAIGNCSLDYEFGSGTITWGSLGIDETPVQVNFSACYPKQDNIQDGIFEFNTITSLDNDLLLATPQSVTAGTTETVNLVFKHAMHKLALTFVPGSGYTDLDISSLSLNINAKTTCLVDGKKGVIKEVKNTFGNYISKGKTALFYLVPQNTSEVTLDISVKDLHSRFTLEELFNKIANQQNDLIGGKCSTLTLKVSINGISVEGGSIGAWENQVTADGEVIIG